MKCPGEVQRIGGRIVFTDEQIKWLKRVFPTTENNVLAETMGISLERFRHFAKEMGLKKSHAGLKAIKRRQVEKALATNIANGCYDRKRGHSVSEATKAGLRKRWDDERAGLRENAQMRIKREDPKRYKAWMENQATGHKEIIRKEIRRIMYNLPRKTKLNLPMNPYKPSQIHHRYNAVKRGYVLSDDCSEGSPDRYIIFYDKDTKRCPQFEKNLIADGFKVQKWE